MSEYTMMDIERVLNGTSSAIRGTEGELKAIIRQLLPDARRVEWIEGGVKVYGRLVLTKGLSRTTIDAAMEAEAQTQAEAKEKEG